MLFKEELAKLIVEGVKTQTRRPCKPSEELVGKFGIKTVLHKGRIKWQVGREYSVQYGRGLPTRYWHETEGLMAWDFYQNALTQEGQKFHEIAKLMGWHLLKIRILDIWEEDVRNISVGDAFAEGFGINEYEPVFDFLDTWANFYDKSALKNPVDWGKRLKERPDNLYHAWALKFEVVKP